MHNAKRNGRPWKIAAVALSAILLWVATPSFAIHGQVESLRFDSLTIEDGLLQNTGAAIVQDRTGYIWIGTEEGLHRYDGYQFTVYQHDPADDNSLSDNYINKIIEDHEGNLWVATFSGGINRFNPRTNEFTRFQAGAEQRAVSSDVIWDVIESHDGYIWLATDDGIDRIDGSSDEVTHYQMVNNDGEVLETERVWTVFEDSQGVLWFGSNLGINRLDPETGRAERFIPELKAKWQEDYFKRVTVNTFAEDIDGSLWVGMEGGLVQLDENREIVRIFEATEFYQGAKPGSPDSEEGEEKPKKSDKDRKPEFTITGNGYVRDMLISSGGELWVGTYLDGLYLFDREAMTFQRYQHDPTVPESLNDNSIFALYEDNTGILWIGTETGGINKFNPATRVFKHYTAHPINKNSLADKVVWSVALDHDNNLWIGTDAGLNKLDREAGHYSLYVPIADDEHSLSNEFPATIYTDSNGDVWVGTVYGVNRYRPKTDDFRRYFFEYDTKDDYFTNGIAFFHEDKQGRFWVGTGTGLVLMDRESGEHTAYFHEDEEDIPANTKNYLLSVYETDDGRLWIGSQGGLSLFDPDLGRFVENYSNDETGPFRLSGSWVQFITGAGQDRLWVSNDQGVDLFDPDVGVVDHLDQDDGLLNDTVYAMLEELSNPGVYWVSTNAGLARFDSKTGEINTFDTTDGLQSNEFNGGAAYRSEQGEMFFGGINGLNSFFPSEVVYRPAPPQVGLTDILVMNNPLELDTTIPELRELVLDHTQTVVTIEFAAFDFAAPSKNQFQYMLDGFDQDWVAARGYNRVTYTNLDAGEYVFNLRGANSHGVWADNAAQLNLEVLPPPWKTWWAYLAYVLLSGGIAFAAYRLQAIRISHMHQLEGEQSKRRWAETLHKLTQSLSASLDAQEVANELLDSLQRMVTFRTAALFVEQGVDINLLGMRGYSNDRQQMLARMPETHSKFFANVRHARQPIKLSPEGLEGSGLGQVEFKGMYFLAVPTYSRADEFAVLLLGRADHEFNEQEVEIVSAFSTQAIVALDNARLFAEVQNLATTDPLTRVNNRRYFFELAELEFSRSKRYHRDVAVILLDADNFKEINENYGHEIGDRVLKIIASTCRSNLRHFDILGRYGGEDFVIMLPETSINVAADVADRLRKSIQNIKLDTHLGELWVTVSVGVAVATEETHDLPALINKADMALYEAKRGGRNRVIVADN